MIKEEIRIFFTALMFYTRIPCPTNIDHSASYLNKSTRYFPLIGWIVGAISGVVYLLSSLLFDTYIATILSLMAGVLVTGAFHEDGLADVFDGFGGGWTKARILDIMKDSRVGAYGVIALIFLFALKFYTLLSVLVQTDPENYLYIMLLFVSYHAISRLTAIHIAFISSYSRENEDSKAKPIAMDHSYKEIGGAYLFGLLPLCGLMFIHWQYVLVIIPLTFLCLYARYYFNKWIDGYTGDCLGAVEQIAECISLLSFLTLWKFL